MQDSAPGGGFRSFESAAKGPTGALCSSWGSRGVWAQGDSCCPQTAVAQIHEGEKINTEGGVTRPGDRGPLRDCLLSRTLNKTCHQPGLSPHRSLVGDRVPRQPEGLGRRPGLVSREVGASGPFGVTVRDGSQPLWAFFWEGPCLSQWLEGGFRDPGSALLPVRRS